MKNDICLNNQPEQPDLVIESEELVHGHEKNSDVVEQYPLVQEEQSFLKDRQEVAHLSKAINSERKIANLTGELNKFKSSLSNFSASLLTKEAYCKKLQRGVLVKLKKMFQINDHYVIEISNQIQEIKNEISIITLSIENINLKIELEKILSDTQDIISNFPVASEQAIKSNPYRYEKYTRFNINKGFDLYYKAIEIIKSIEQNNISCTEESAAMQEFNAYLDQIRESSELVMREIIEGESRLMNAKMLPGRFISREETWRNMISINRSTEKYREGIWDEEKIAEMTVDQLKVHINENGSARYFLHSFPEISIRNGYISTSIGAGDDFHNVRGDSSDHINFTAESNADYQRSFYGTFNAKFSGGVYYPAEVLLENYPIINLPYSHMDDGSIGTSSEWCSYAPSENPQSKFHHVQLNLGVCFFSEEHRVEIEQLIRALPVDMQPNKIIWYSGDEHVALNNFLSTIKKPDDLPHLSSPLKIIREENGFAMFGTDKTKKDFY